MKKTMTINVYSVQYFLLYRFFVKLTLQHKQIYCKIKKDEKGKGDIKNEPSRKI